MTEISVKSQGELDAIKKDFDGTIFIDGGTQSNPLELKVDFQYASVIVRGSVWVMLWGSSHAVLWGSSHAVLWESSHAVLWGSSHAVLRESSHAELRESSHAVLWGSSHAELRESSHAVLWGSSHAVLRESSHAELRESSHAVLWGSSHAVLWESSHAELRESSHAELRESSHAELRESSHAVLRESSHAELRESSHAELRESSHAVLWGSSHAVLWGSSHAVLWGEAMISAFSAESIIAHGYNVISVSKSNRKGMNIVTNKNSTLKIVPDFKPTLTDFKKRYPVTINKTKAILYKAVHKQGKKYVSDYDRTFTYQIGKVAAQVNDPSKDDACSYGLHVAYKSWARCFGMSWSDLAILECEVNTKDIVVARNTDGEVRCSKLKVLREVPESEWY